MKSEGKILNYIDSPMKIKNTSRNKQLFFVTCVLAAALGLSGCGSKEKKAGQALASVNGEEITVLQLNEELQRSGVQAAQQEVASKQLLEALIDRQLLQNEAVKEKIDRDPKVMQAIERAKALIIAQAYMQGRVGTIAKASKAEVEDYFQKNPGLFTNRKQFEMKDLVIATKDLDPALKAAMDAAKSLEEVAVWMDAHQVKFARTQISRTSADLAPELVAKLLAMPKGQLFIIKEGERSMLIALADVKEAPVTLEAAAPQIEQFLFNKRSKEAADIELKRLRSTAKIEYLNKSDVPAKPAVESVAAASASASVDSNAKGVAGLK